MKKFKSLITIVLVLVFTVIAGACSERLESPTGLFVDDTNTLIWNIVNEARTYTVEVKSVESGETKEEVARRNSFLLSELAEGDYELRVKAVGGRQNSLVSEWSEVLYFHKDYDSGLVYTLINGGKEYEIGRSGKVSGDLVIEDNYRDKPITRISQGAFRGCGELKSVVVGNNVKEVGAGAFVNCSQLLSVALPEGLLSLGESVFQQCSLLTEVNIPTGISQIPDYAFAYCRALPKIQLHEGITSIGGYAFCNCDLLQEINIPDAVGKIGTYAFYLNKSLASAQIGSGIEKIGTYAFNGCSALKEVKMPAEAPLNIGSYAFSGCTALDSITIPDGTTTLADGVFWNTALAEIAIPDSVTRVGSVAFSGTPIYNSQAANGFIYADKWLVATTPELKGTITEITSDTFKPDTFGIADKAFMLCSLLEEVALPSSVKYIGSASFAQNPILYRFTTNDNSLVEVGDSAFNSCKLLANVQFGRGLETIGSYAFFGCSALDNNQFDVERLVPESVKRIGTYAFNDTALWEKPDKFGVVYAGNWVVGSDGASGDVELKEEVVGIADYAFFMNDALGSVTGLNRVQYVGRGAFFYCVRLGSVSLNRNLRVIKEYTFYHCDKLAMVNFPARLTEIERYAFSHCPSLWDIDLSETQLKKIAYRAFSESGIMSTVKLPETLETIESYAFYHVGLTKTLEIPGAVKYIGHRAFALNIFLDEVVIGDGVETIGSYAFKGCVRMSRVVLPESMKTIGAYAFYDCGSLDSIDFGGTQTIGSYAFARNTKLSSLVIPQSVVSIGDYAFRDCSNLTSVIFPNTLEYVGVNAFYGCNKMTAYVGGGQELENDWGKWNSSFRPVVWNSTLSEDGTYVEAVTIGVLSNVFEGMNLLPPVRAGYEFVGWATTPNGEAVYTAEDIMKLEPGKTVYAVWKEAPVESDPPAENPVTPPEEDPVPPSGGLTPEEIDAILREYFAQLNI